MGPETFSVRLRAAMDKGGLKQADLIRIASERGQKLGKSQLSQYLSGKTTPRPDMLSFLSDALGVGEDWLSEGVELLNAPLAGATASESSPDRASGLSSEPSATSSSAGLGDAPVPAAAPVAVPSLGQPITHKPFGPAFAGPAPTPEDIARASENTPALAPTPKKGTPMRQFKKSSRLENVRYEVRGPVVDEAHRMEAEGTYVLKLNIGNPAPFDFRAPAEVVYDMSRQLADCEGYSDSRGLFSARKAIMQYAQIKGIPGVTMEDIYTGNGASDLINIAMSALLDDGDEILIPSPDYPLWTACATLAGGKVVHYRCDEQAEWYPDMDDIRSKITPATKGIVIINPNNPTGALYPREVLEEIVQIARENQLIIFSDEIYDRLVMDGLEHVSIASLAPDLFCVTFSGLSKSHMIAGYRVGWMILSGNKRIAKDYIAGINLLSNMRLCSNVPGQSIVQTALWGHQSVKDYIVPGGRMFEQREYVYNALNDIPGISVVKPKAAFYIFPKIDVARFNITDDVQFALDLLHDEHLLIVQGTGFNWKEPDHFRVVYLPRIEVLNEAMGKLRHFLSYYQQA